MPLTFGAINAFVSPYTPSQGSKGVGTSVASAISNIQNDRAYRDIAKSQEARASEKASTEDYRALMSTLQAALSTEPPDMTLAKFAADELRGKFGVNVKLPTEDPTAAGPQSPNAETASAEASPAPPEPSEDAAAPWLTEELGKRGELPGQTSSEAPSEGPPAWLENELASRGDIPTPSLPVSPGTAALKTPEASAAPSTATPPGLGAVASAPKRYQVYGKDGRLITEGDVGGGLKGGLMAQSFAPVIEHAPDEYARNAAVAGQEFATYLSRWLPPEKAFEAGIQYMEGELDRRSKEARSGHTGGGGLGGGGVPGGARPGGAVAIGTWTPGTGSPAARRTEQGASLDMAKFLASERDRVGRQYGVPLAQKTLWDSQRLIDMAQSGSSLGEIISVAQNIKQQFGAAASEGERAFVRGAEPWVDSLLLKLQSLGTNSGARIADDMLKDIVSVAQIGTNAAQAQLERARQDFEFSVGEGNPYFEKLQETTEEKAAVRHAARGAYGASKREDNGQPASGDPEREKKKADIAQKWGWR